MPTVMRPPVQPPMPTGKRSQRAPAAARSQPATVPAGTTAPALLSTPLQPAHSSPPAAHPATTSTHDPAVCSRAEVAPSTLLDLHVVTSQQLESTYGTTTEAVLLTDQAHRQLWANTAYDTLLASYTHADARPQAVSLSCYAYHDPASVECRSILWTFLAHTSDKAVPTRPSTSSAATSLAGGVVRPTAVVVAAPAAVSPLVRQYTATLAKAAAAAVARAAAAGGVDCRALLQPRAPALTLASPAASSRETAAAAAAAAAGAELKLKRRRGAAKAAVGQPAKVQRRQPTKSGKVPWPTDEWCSNSLKRVASERTLEVSSVLANMWSAVL